MRARYCAMIKERLGLGEGQPRRRARQQRRLPAAALPAARRAGARHRAGRQRGRSRRSTRASRRASNSSASSSPRSWPREGNKADLIVGNNVLAQVPDLNDFVAGHRASLEARRRRHARVPPSRAADRGEPVRHHLPRALLLLLAHHDRASRRTHGLKVIDVEELPTHGGSLRVYLAHRRIQRDASQRVERRCSPSERGGRASRRSRPTRPSPSR